MSACKTEAQDVDPEGMIETIRGGKVVWITCEEMNNILAVKRRVSGLKCVQ